MTGADGLFRVDVRLPADIPLGANRVVAATPGDDSTDGAISR